MLGVKGICPMSKNVPTPVPTANVTFAAPVEMDYRWSKQGGLCELACRAWL